MRAANLTGQPSVARPARVLTHATVRSHACSLAPSAALACFAASRFAASQFAALRFAVDR
jgi:hypothetical protein